MTNFSFKIHAHETRNNPVSRNNSVKNLHDSCTDRAKTRRESCTKFAEKLHETPKIHAENLHRSEPESGRTVALREQQIGPRGKCCFAAHQLQRQATHYVITPVISLKTKQLMCGGLPL